MINGTTKNVTVASISFIVGYALSCFFYWSIWGFHSYQICLTPKMTPILQVDEVTFYSRSKEYLQFLAYSEDPKSMYALKHNALVTTIKKLRNKAQILREEISRLQHCVANHAKLNVTDITDLYPSSSFVKTNKATATTLKAIQEISTKEHWSYSETNYMRTIVGKIVENIFTKKNGSNKDAGLVLAYQYYSEPEVKTEDFSNFNETIWIILPLFKRAKVFERFLNTVSAVIPKFKGYVVLQVVLHQDKGGDWERIRDMIVEIKRKIRVELILTDEPFNRGFSAHLGTRNVQESELILFVDVDMTFDEQFLDRIRSNTIAGKQVYFPICLSQHDPKVRCFGHSYCDIDTKNVSNSYGFWRHFGYGMASMYKADYTSIGGFDVKIKGWGTEDIILYDRCFRKGLTIFRSIDPSLVHIYHKKTCDKSLPKNRFYSCLNSGRAHSGDVRDLYNALVKLNMSLSN